MERLGVFKLFWIYAHFIVSEEILEINFDPIGKCIPWMFVMKYNFQDVCVYGGGGVITNYRIDDDSWHTQTDIPVFWSALPFPALSKHWVELEYGI